MTLERKAHLGAAAMIGVAIAGCSSVADDGSKAERAPELGPSGVSPRDEPSGESCSEEPAEGLKVEDFNVGFSVDTSKWPIPKSTFNTKGSFNMLLSQETPTYSGACTETQRVSVTGGFGITVFSNGIGAYVTGGGGATETGTMTCTSPPQYSCVGPYSEQAYAQGGAGISRNFNTELGIPGLKSLGKVDVNLTIGGGLMGGGSRQTGIYNGCPNNPGPETKSVYVGPQGFGRAEGGFEFGRSFYKVDVGLTAKACGQIAGNLTLGCTGGPQVSIGNGNYFVTVGLDAASLAEQGFAIQGGVNGNVAQKCFYGPFGMKFCVRISPDFIFTGDPTACPAGI